nr:MAG TPA: hypothetical protein [Caudoviricetes sp.]
MEGTVDDVAPHFFFPPKSKPLFISPEPLSYYIYAKGLRYIVFIDQSF